MMRVGMSKWNKCLPKAKKDLIADQFIPQQPNQSFTEQVDPELIPRQIARAMGGVVAKRILPTLKERLTPENVDQHDELRQDFFVQNPVTHAMSQKFFKVSKIAMET